MPFCTLLGAKNRIYAQTKPIKIRTLGQKLNSLLQIVITNLFWGDLGYKENRNPSEKPIRNKVLSFQLRLELLVTLELAAMEKPCWALIRYSRGINAHVIPMTSYEIERCYIGIKDQNLYLKPFSCRVLKILPTQYKLYRVFQTFNWLLLTKAKASKAIGFCCFDLR